jgi:hypothetical protein
MQSPDMPAGINGACRRRVAIAVENIVKRYGDV